MGQQLPIALQVALYAASGAILVLVAVLVPAVLRLKKQLDRTVTAVEHLEAELTPLAHETRVVVDQLGDLAGGVQRVVGAAGGLLLPPVRAFNRTAQLVQTGATTFLQALWNGRR
jgi:hypothetical protein